MNWTPSKIGSIVACVILLCILIYTIRMEKADLMCPNIHCESSECYEGNGKAYFGSKPETADSNTVLLDKIMIAAHADKVTVKWRRSYILAFIITCLLYLLVHRRVPEIYESVLSIVFIMIVFYFSFSYYEYHHLQHATDNLTKCVDILKENVVKLELGKKSIRRKK